MKITVFAAAKCIRCGKDVRLGRPEGDADRVMVLHEKRECFLPDRPMTPQQVHNVLAISLMAFAPDLPAVKEGSLAMGRVKR